MDRFLITFSQSVKPLGHHFDSPLEQVAVLGDEGALEPLEVEVVSVKDFEPLTAPLPQPGDRVVSFLVEPADLFYLEVVRSDQSSHLSFCQPVRISRLYDDSYFHTELVFERSR